MKTINNAQYLDRSEVADVFQISRITVPRWFETYGLIPTIIGHRYFYHIDEVRRVWESIFHSPLVFNIRNGHK